MNGDDADEDSREDLGSVEYSVIRKPDESSTDDSMPVVTSGKLQRSDIVSRSVGSLLCLLESGVGVGQLVVSKVSQVQGRQDNDTKLNPESPLNGRLAIRSCQGIVCNEETDD